MGAASPENLVLWTPTRDQEYTQRIAQAYPLRVAVPTTRTREAGALPPTPLKSEHICAKRVDVKEGAFEYIYLV